jgi:two-component system cell cycle response regulator
VSQARILAVDDQLYFRVFLEDLLVQEGYAVTIAESGAQALERFDEARFDLVLTDLVMPGMGGVELVQALKERRPDQDVVVITSVGDVKTAVDAMKLGATDYLLKPIDKAALLRTLDSILERRAMREEHAQLMAENLEYMGVFGSYERALGLFSTLSVEPLVDRVVEGLCLETRAHGGVLWLARAHDPDRLKLQGVRGLVRVDEERPELDLEALPEAMAPLLRAEITSRIVPSPEDAPGARASLLIPLRHGGRLLAVVRLNDKLDGSEFGPAERQAAERFASFAAQALANALQFRALERRSFRDATTGAYTRAYFDDVVEKEIQKANRFGRTFSLVRLALDPIAVVRAQMPPPEFVVFGSALAGTLGRALRTTDLLAAESEGCFLLLLPETDCIGATVVKRRLRALLERSDEVRSLEPEDRPVVLSAVASFPADASSLDGLRTALDRRIEIDRKSLLRAMELEQAPFRGVVDALLAEAEMGRPEFAEQALRFVFDEVARQPEERGLLFVAPGTALAGAVRDGLEGLRGLDLRTEVVLLADRRDEGPAGIPLTRVSPLRAGTDLPFLVWYGAGPGYAMLREDAPAGERPAFYHTDDPVVVEHLAFQLGRDLGIPIGE